MNKMIWIPFTTIILLALVASVYVHSDSPFAGTFNNSGGNGTITLANETASTAQSFNVPPFVLIGAAMALVILVSAIAISSASGFHLLGSGLSTTTQKLLFNSIVYLGLWAVFSVVAFPILSAMMYFGIMLWMLLTIMFIMGFARTIQGADVE